MVKHYYVDLENVNEDAFSGIERLTEEDFVFILYGQAPAKLSFNCVAALVNTNATIKIIKSTSRGENALDYRLVGLLAKEVIKSPITAHYIISKDLGYVAAIETIEEEIVTASVGLASSIQDTLTCKRQLMVAAAY